MLLGSVAYYLCWTGCVGVFKRPTGMRDEAGAEPLAQDQSLGCTPESAAVCVRVHLSAYTGLFIQYPLCIWPWVTG